MSKKLFVFLLTAVLCFCLSAAVFAADDASSVASGTCGDNLTWVLDEDGVLTISGSGEMYDFVYDGAPWYAYYPITSVIIEDGITSIGDFAFMDCWMTSITLPDTLISIGEEAFSFCTALTGITLPDSLTSIGEDAFAWCNFESITIPASVTSIGASAFYMIEGLETIKFLGDAPMIGEDAFFWVAEAIAYYPAVNSTWTEDVMQQYGAESITWVAYDTGSSSGEDETEAAEVETTGAETKASGDSESSSEATATDTETATTTTSGSVNTSDLSIYVLIALVMMLGVSGFMIWKLSVRDSSF